MTSKPFDEDTGFVDFDKKASGDDLVAIETVGNSGKFPPFWQSKPSFSDARILCKIHAAVQWHIEFVNGVLGHKITPICLR